MIFKSKSVNETIKEIRNFISILAVYRYVPISVFHTVLTGNLGVEEK